MSKKLNRKMVEIALILKSINGNEIQIVSPGKDLKHVYCGKFQSNEIDSVTTELYYNDLIGGKGGELSSIAGRAPKFNSISSSTALAVNTFAPWKECVSKLKIKTKHNDFLGFDKLCFEHSIVTKNNRSPHLDVWLEWKNGILAIECKFCEFLGSPSYTEIQSSYLEMIKKEGYRGPWIDAIEKVTNESMFKYFDVAQIIKHYFGIINTEKPEKHLLYLYWHPETMIGKTLVLIRNYFKSWRFLPTWFRKPLMLGFTF